MSCTVVGNTVIDDGSTGISTRPLTLEQRLELIAGQGKPLEEDDKRELSRILQLARREGYRRAYVSEHGERSPERIFPIRRTVTELRVEPDPQDSILWRYNPKSFRLEWADKALPGRWSTVRAMAAFPARIDVWSSLIASPTITREVEE